MPILVLTKGRLTSDCLRNTRYERLTLSAFTIRQLSFNLRDPKNPDLRRCVADGVIDPTALLGMSPEELGSVERRENNQAIRCVCWGWWTNPNTRMFFTAACGARNIYQYWHTLRQVRLRKGVPLRYVRTSTRLRGPEYARLFT